MRDYRHQTVILVDGKPFLSASLERGPALGADLYELAYDRTATVRCESDKCTGTVDGIPLKLRRGLAGEPRRRDGKPIAPLAPFDADLLQGLGRLDAQAKRNRSRCRPAELIWSANCGDCFAPELTSDGSSLIGAAVTVGLGPGFNGRGAPVGSTGEAWLRVFEETFWCGRCTTPGRSR